MKTVKEQKNGKSKPQLVLGEFVSQEQLAQQLNVHVKSIQNYRAAGMPSTKLGKHILLHVPTVIEWLKARQTLNRFGQGR